MAAPMDRDLLANLLLSKLAPADRMRLSPNMTILRLEASDIIHLAGDNVDDTWFPCDGAMASFRVATDCDASPVEVALVGREGAIGGIVSDGHLPAFATAEVRFGGLFLKIETAALEAAKLESISLRHWSSRYSDCLLAQIFQAAACNATHTIAQRTAKWLLAVSERTQAHVLDLTQEELSQFLGVSRTYVTSTLKMLSAGGLIATRRGGVEILDEAALQEVSCACATAVRAHFEAVMSDVYPAA